MTLPPTVVLDESCANLEEAVGKFASTFLFKRSGGFLAEPRSAAAEMFAQLTERQIAKPYLLVGASYAGFTQLLFAAKWPQDVAGLILVDPSHPKQGEEALAILSDDRVGTSKAIEEFRALVRGFGPGWDAGCRQVAEVRSLGDVPLVVLAAGAPETPEDLDQDIRRSLIQGRHKLLREYCKLTTRGEMRVIEGVGHAIARSAPLTVIDSIRQMYESGGSASQN